MKQTLATLTLISALAIPAFGQAVEPENADIFYQLEGDKLVSLEQQPVALQSGTQGFIAVNVKAAAEIPGEKSPIRFKSGTPLSFVVRSGVPVADIDPNAIYSLWKLNQGKKKTRELVLVSGSGTPFGATVKVSTII